MYKLYIVILMLSWPLIAAAECKKLTTANEVLKCIVSNHSKVQISQSRIESSVKAAELASQRPNPEFEFEGTVSDEGSLSSNVAFLHTFELGGKLSARVDVAEKESELLQANLIDLKDKIAIQSVIDLYKYRQLEQEENILDETIESFSHISKKYSKAGRLDPQNTISEAIFNMALDESLMSKNSLSNEKLTILNRIEMGIGRRITLNRKHLPQIVKKWPAIQSGDVLGAEIVKAKNEIEYQKARYALEKSKSSPDLLIGPKFELDDKDFRVGIALSLPLPLYQRNEGGKAKALAEIATSELGFNLIESNLKRQRQHLYELYVQISKKYSQSLSNSRIMKRHNELHSLSKRGIVSPALIIELHRQVLEYYKNLHQLELEGVIAFWKIAAIEGRISQETLK